MRRLVLAVVLLACGASSWAGLTRHDVVVIANSAVPASVAVANYYKTVRNIPASHVKLVTAPTGDSFTPAEFAAFRGQVVDHLNSLGSVSSDPANDPIKAIVLCTGIPHYINRNGEAYGATDSALAALFTDSSWGKWPIGIYGDFQPAPGGLNGYFGEFYPAASFDNYRKSGDQGVQIEAFPNPGFTIVRMLDTDAALAAGGGGMIYRGVRTGGSWTWTPVQSPDRAMIGWRVSSICVLDSQRAWVCTGNTVRPHGGGTILATSDGGLTWRQIRYSSRGSGWKLRDALVGVDFVDSSAGWAVGSSLNAYGSYSPYMIKTTNSTTWSDISSGLPSGFYPRAVSAADAQNVWICGAGGKIYRSSDAGTTWTLANTGAPTADYNAIWIKSDAGAFRGWAVGDSGKVIRTEDGSNWTQQASGLTTSNITDLAVYDSSHVCASYGATSYLYYNGSTWQKRNMTLAPVSSCAAAQEGQAISVAANRYIFSESAGAWGCVYTGLDTAWKLRYIVSRLDGYRVDADPADGIPDDIKALIDRACAATSPGTFILDEAVRDELGNPMDPDVWEETNTALASLPSPPTVTWDRTATYLTGRSNVIGLASHGVHDGDADAATTWGRTFHNWANGGITMMYESADGRQFTQPQYVWGMYVGGTLYPNKLTVTGFRAAAGYAGYRAVLYSGANEELASGYIVSGECRIDLSGVAWPADRKTYVRVFWPAADPFHPGEWLDHASYPWAGSSTEVYDNRATGFTVKFSLARTLMAEFLHEGASGCIANVDEPWALYCGQPVYVFPRYASGFTWGESAYSGLAGLGWQEAVAGDPLMAPFSTPPSVSVVSPASDYGVVSGELTVAASALPNNSPGIARVEFWLDDDTRLASDAIPPYETQIDASTLADGFHTLEALAFESDATETAGSAQRVFVVCEDHTWCGNIGEALALSDGNRVMLYDLPVSAVFNGFFYVQDSGSTHGIRVVSSALVSEGNRVAVFGTLQLTEGEREILATDARMID